MRQLLFTSGDIFLHLKLKKILKRYHKLCNVVLYFIICYSCYEISSLKWYHLSSSYTIFPLLCTVKWGHYIPWPLPLLPLESKMNQLWGWLASSITSFMENQGFLEIFVVNGWQLENIGLLYILRTIDILFSKKLIGEREGENSCNSASLILIAGFNPGWTWVLAGF